MDIVQQIGKIPGMKPVLKKVFKGAYEKRLQNKIAERAKTYKQFGLEALTKFNECMTANNFRYTLAFGSMLGAIREHGFIKHDLDIDTWMFIEDDNEKLVPELEKYGFHLLYHYSIDNDKLGKEYTFDYNGCHIDIFFIFPAINKYPYCNDFVHEEKHIYLPRRIEMPFSREIRYEKFENLELPVPANAVELCEYRYGKGFMTPNPQWNWERAKESVVEWREMMEKTTHKSIDCF